MACALIVVVRAIFTPATPRLRLLPMDDDRARYWAWNMSWLVAFVAVTEIFVRELIADVVSPVTSRATMVVIYTLVAGYLIALILRNRREIPRYFESQSAKNPEDITLAILASVLRYWHWGAILYVLTLLHRLLISGANGLDMILTATKVIAAFALGTFVMTLISNAAQRGIGLPARIARSMPALQDRLNTFVPAFLRLTRLGIFLAWLGYTLHAVDIIDLAEWFQRRVGVDVVAATASVMTMLLLALFVWLALTSWVDYRLQPRRGQSPTPRERTLLVLTRNAAAVAIVLFTLMSLLSELGISVAPLLASAGVLGLAIGFGAQKMVEDIIGGVFIQLENAVNVGDIVQAAGITGVVEELTIRSVGLRDLQGVYHVIPFSAVSTVSNFTKGFGYHVADIGIAYRENIDQAKGEMLAAFDELRADPETGAKLIGDLEWFGVEALGDSAVTLRARLKTWPGDQWAIGRAFNERVKKRFDAAGIEIPFPHLTLWFGEGKDGAAPPANLALSRATARPALRAAPETPPANPPLEVDPNRGRMRPPGAPTDADEDGAGAGDGMHSDGGDAPR